MEGIFFELTIVLVVAAVLAFLLRYLKQPTILAYILTGIIIGPLAFFGRDVISSTESFEEFSKIGIALLLFMLGLEMKISDLRSVGKTAIITGLGQIFFTSLAGFVFAVIIGFSTIESFYMAVALTFSSTIVIVKLLSDKQDINSLYGKISIGFLLIQDFVAIIALVLLNGLGTAANVQLDPIEVVALLARTFVVFSIIIFLSQSVFPKIVHKLSESLEVLFAFSLAWAFGVAALISSDFVGLSIEIGGFLAGLALANSVESFQIVSKIKALRDFFIIIFFVHLGMTLQLNSLDSSIIPALFFSIFVLVGNPLIVLAILGAMGYKARTGFLSGLTVAQISEFSLIVIFIGRDLGHVSDQVVSIVTLVGIITFAISSYLIQNGEKIYDKLDRHLKPFERKNTRESKDSFSGVMEQHIVIIGADQMGMAILKNLEDKKDNVLVIDFDPQIISNLQGQGYKCIFGDITEPEILEQANITAARVVISTIPNVEDNIILVSDIRAKHPEVEIVVNVERPQDKDPILNAGASMVIQPFELAGRMLGNLVQHEELELKE